MTTRHRKAQDQLRMIALEPELAPAVTAQNRRSFYEFFAGGGMARAGLGQGWQCLFANDFDLKKSRVYVDHWGTGAMKPADVGTLTVEDLPGSADLVWASFPCQDLSLAGAGAGLRGDRSGTFWPFWRLMQSLVANGRAPRIIALENVCGALTSHNGTDFTAICGAVCAEGYRVGALVIDAALFVPHSRPRLFILAVRADIDLPAQVTRPNSMRPWHTDALNRAYAKLPPGLQAQWIWWSLPTPPRRCQALADIIEEAPTTVQWHSRQETDRLLDMMSEANRAKVMAAQRLGRTMVGGMYKRTREDGGAKVQRAEVRFDGLAGCLRTPAGGSSRQILIIVQGDSVRSRLISPRETARLMGLPETYALPENYNEAYHLTGDGVVVPVVRHIAAHIFEPVLAGTDARALIAA